MKALLDFLILPQEISSVEERYLARMNRLALIVFAAHIPVIMAVAALAGGSIARAFVFTTTVVAGPVLASFAFQNPRYRARFSGFCAMIIGGLLVHFGQGPMQIEMHFYFFVLLAALVVFADPLVIVVAAATVATHHLLLFLLLPRSVFNYDASIWAVVIHAAFVVLETCAICFIARNFFDRVIGLERIVNEKTAEIAARAKTRALILDTIDQGFMVVAADGRLPEERSRVLHEWLGPAREGDTFWSYVGRSDAKACTWLEVGWEGVFEGALPVELALDQLPKRMTAGERTLELGYRVVDDDSGANPLVLVVISDVSSAIERERAERLKEELVAAVGWILRDRGGFVDFLGEATEMVDRIVSRAAPNEERRLIHTLKGNASTFGMNALSSLCHQLESQMAEDGSPLDDDQRGELERAFIHATGHLRDLLERGDGSFIEVTEEEHAALIGAVRAGASTADLVRRLDELRLEPLERRLTRLARQAEDLAKRLGKDVRVEVNAGAARLDAATLHKVWPTLIHLVRNAVDHGIESDSTRLASGKTVPASIALRLRGRRDGVVLDFEDDGRGIDWAVVAERARELGLPSEGRDALESALFVDGLSTRRNATELSGRGVGLSAVREALDSVGGYVKVESQAGMGSRFSIFIPRRGSDPAPAVRVTRRASVAPAEMLDAT